ncbi:hypothetical protein HPB48_017139 [Haemaphysalis longicornis]|uniref:Uncharacterized protein n=1 Tax=Haemaphysalis longicornis TaxID=44386 RepID=A0A9J6FWY8_HAELO|nr:hypothetical protein HPB48_017139 [Haemaphysalis longicornis]
MNYPTQLLPLEREGASSSGGQRFSVSERLPQDLFRDWHENAGAGAARAPLQRPDAALCCRAAQLLARRLRARRPLGAHAHPVRGTQKCRRSHRHGRRHRSPTGCQVGTPLSQKKRRGELCE